MLQAVQWRVQNEVVITTTSSTAISASGVATVTPASMQSILVGAQVTVDVGGVNQEVVTVTSVTTSTFTATFANTHTTTPYTLTVSPFSLFDTAADQFNPGGVSDAVRFGTNPIAASHSGSINNVIYLGYPKDPKPEYTAQCTISLLDELVYRRAFGGKIWHETPLYLSCRFLAMADWYQAEQTAIAVADAAWVVINKHAELPDAPVVQAVKEGAKGTAPTGFFYEQLGQFTWFCWATFWWHRREWFITGGIQP